VAIILTESKKCDICARMKTLIALLLITFSSCSTVYYGQTNCGITAAGDWDSRFAPSWLTNEKLNHWVNVAIDAASMTTDPVLFDQAENCKSLNGFRVYTKDVDSWYDEWNGYQVGGITNCWFKIIIVNKPLGGTNESATSIVHELIHAMQHC